MINWGHKSQENDKTKDPELENKLQFIWINLKCVFDAIYCFAKQVII